MLVHVMAQQSTEPALLTCLNCGYEAPLGESWNEVDHPPLGTLTRCPDCGSTNVHSHE